MTSIDPASGCRSHTQATQVLIIFGNGSPPRAGYGTGIQKRFEATTAAVRELIDPSTQTELRSISGLCKVYRRFVPNFSRVAAPLHKKLRKDQHTSFPSPSPAEKSAVENLKTLLRNPSILPLARATSQYTVDTDACNSQVACVLLQQQEDGIAKSIGYWSRTLTSAEQKLTTTDKESVAVE